MQGTSTPYGQQSYSRSGSGAQDVTTYQQAEQQLTRYGFGNVRDLRPTQGWSADAVKNGQRVHVILSDNGQIATFPRSQRLWRERIYPLSLFHKLETTDPSRACPRYRAINRQSKECEGSIEIERRGSER
jgi:hypothetical protein